MSEAQLKKEERAAHLKREAYLRKVLDPLMVYARWFYEESIRPSLELQRLMKIENQNRERLIIKQLDRQRAHAQYAKDCRESLLHFAGEKKLLHHRPPLLTGGGEVACHYV